MAIKFDIINYISGFTSYVFDKAVLERIALDRGIDEAEDIYDLSKKQKDLVLADELLTIYLSPTMWASMKHSHGDFSCSVGQQTVTISDKNKLYQIIHNIYTEYNDPKLNFVKDANVDDATVSFIDM